MASTRRIFCPACGRRLLIPAETPAGKKARCGACTTIFLVPQPIPRKQLRTLVGQYNIGDLPTDLQKAIGVQTGPHPASEDVTRERPSVPTTHTRRPRYRFKSLTQACRKAFDLESSNDPQLRTGAGVYRLPTGYGEDET